MTLRHLTIFREVCREESVTLAAEHLNMTQPSVSLAIRELESFYGVRLFERMNRRIYITEPGRTLLQYADTILSQYDESVRVLQEGRHTGSCRFGVHVTFGEIALPNILKRLSERLPQIAVRTVVTNTRENEEMLLRNELDFAVVANVLRLDFLISTPLYKEPMYAVCTSDYRTGERITLEELAGERLLLREKGSGTRDDIDEVFQAAGLSASVALDSASTYVLLKCAESGFGITILPRSLTENALRDGKLKALHVEGGSFFQRYYLAYHKSKYLTESVRQVINVVKDSCPDSSSDAAGCKTGLPGTEYAQP